jgi:hypothetical protein
MAGWKTLCQVFLSIFHFNLIIKYSKVIISDKNCSMRWFNCVWMNLVSIFNGFSTFFHTVYVELFTYHSKYGDLKFQKLTKFHGNFPIVSSQKWQLIVSKNFLEIMGVKIFSLDISCVFHVGVWHKRNEFNIENFPFSFNIRKYYSKINPHENIDIWIICFRLYCFYFLFPILYPW